MFNSKKSFGKIEQYVQDDIASPDISVPPLGNPVKETIDSLKESIAQKDGIYTAKYQSPTKHFAPSINVIEDDPGISFTTIVGFVVALVMVAIGLFILSQMASQIQVLP